MSLMALLTIGSIVLLIVLLMLFYRFGAVLEADEHQPELLTAAQYPLHALDWASLQPDTTADSGERRLGIERRSLPLLRGQIGQIGQIGVHRDRRRHTGRRREDSLWIY